MSPRHPDVGSATSKTTMASAVLREGTATARRDGSKRLWRRRVPPGGSRRRAETADPSSASRIVHDALNARLEERGPKVHQNSKAPVGQPEIGQELLREDRVVRLRRFH